MISPADFLIDLCNPMLSFLPRALLVSVLSALMCAIVGVHVVLRGMAFIGDALAHSVFPGLAIAFLMGGSLVLGGLVAGLVTAILVAVFSQSRRLREDSVIGVFFVGAFALGVLILSRAPGYAGSLSQFLFGSLTGVSWQDVGVSAVTAVVAITILAAAHKEIESVSLDRELARTMGLPVFAVDLLLYVVVTVCVVMSIQTIGNILVLALLVTPAATARLLTDRMGVMMTWSAGLGVSGSLLGVYLSWALDLPAGAAIVCVLSVCFVVAWLAAPRHGVITSRLRRATHVAADTTQVVTDPAPVAAHRVSAGT